MHDERGDELRVPGGEVEGHEAAVGRAHQRGRLAGEGLRQVVLEVVAQEFAWQLEPVPHPGIRDPRVDQHESYGRPSSSSTARNASCGTSTRPTCFMRFLPAFCFSSSLRLRLTSPP